METKITVTALDHEELVDLLSTALYGSSWFGAGYDHKIYDTLTEKQGDCFEDELADMLLAGHKIRIIDYYAEGDKYSTKFVRFSGEDAIYEVDLKDFLEVASTKRGYKLLEDLLSGEGEGDYWTADSFLQTVVFGEVVYG